MKGQNNLLSLGFNERLYIGVLTKGVDFKLVEGLVTVAELKFTDTNFLVEDVSLWHIRDCFQVDEYVCYKVEGNIYLIL